MLVSRLISTVSKSLYENHILTRNKTEEIVLHYCDVNISIFVPIYQQQESPLLFLLLVMATGGARLIVVLLVPSCHHLLLVFLANFSLDSDLLGNSKKLLFPINKDGKVRVNIPIW